MGSDDTEVRKMRFQTMTFEEQSQVLDHLDKARGIIKQSHNGDNNTQNQELVESITRVFHEVQTAETGEL